MLDEEMKLWARSEELKRQIEVQRVQDEVLTEQLQGVEEEKLKAQAKIALMTLDSERLTNKLRCKEKELAMLENHRTKLESCIQMLTADDPSNEALEEERVKIGDFKERAVKFAGEMQQSPWIPAMNKLRKSLESDMEQLQKAREEKARLEEAVKQEKDVVNFHLENLFIPLVVKLAKYRWQREEMVRIYAAEVKEHGKIRREQEIEEQQHEPHDEAMMETSENINEAADPSLNVPVDEAVMETIENINEAPDPSLNVPVDEGEMETSENIDEAAYSTLNVPVDEGEMETSENIDEAAYSTLNVPVDEGEMMMIHDETEKLAEIDEPFNFNASVDFNADFNASGDFTLPDWMMGPGGEEDAGADDSQLFLDLSLGFGNGGGGDGEEGGGNGGEKKRGK